MSVSSEIFPIYHFSGPSHHENNRFVMCTGWINAKSHCLETPSLCTTTIRREVTNHWRLRRSLFVRDIETKLRKRLCKIWTNKSDKWRLPLVENRTLSQGGHRPLRDATGSYDKSYVLGLQEVLDVFVENVVEACLFRIN